jgi:hypothetical protein
VKLSRAEFDGAVRERAATLNGSLRGAVIDSPGNLRGSPMAVGPRRLTSGARPFDGRPADRSGHPAGG